MGTLFGDPVWVPRHCLRILLGDPVRGPCLATNRVLEEEEEVIEEEEEEEEEVQIRHPCVARERPTSWDAREAAQAGRGGRPGRRKDASPHLPLRSREQLGPRGLSVDLRRAIRNMHLVFSMDRTTIDRWDRQHTSTGGI